MTYLVEFANFMEQNSVKVLRFESPPRDLKIDSNPN